MTTILNNIKWLVYDHDLEDYVFIDNEELNKDEFLRRLSQISMNWTPYPDNPSNVIFLYPVKYDLGQTNDNYVPVESIVYPISSLPTALEVIGAISTYYGQKLAIQQAPELFGVNDGLIMTNQGYYTSNIYRSDLLYDNNLFKGLKMIRPGVYLIIARRSD